MRKNELTSFDIEYSIAQVRKEEWTILVRDWITKDLIWEDPPM